MDENPDPTHLLANKHRFLIHKLLVKSFYLIQSNLPVACSYFFEKIDTFV
jgi:hypothetical protein